MNVMDDFEHLNGKTQSELLTRAQELKGEGPARELSDEALQELLAITRVLRKRTTAPVKASAKKAPPPTLDAL